MACMCVCAPQQCSAMLMWLENVQGAHKTNTKLKMDQEKIGSTIHRFIISERTAIYEWIEIENGLSLIQTVESSQNSRNKSTHSI